jgi:hypothetical protein
VTELNRLQSCRIEYKVDFDKLTKCHEGGNMLRVTVRELVRSGIWKRGEGQW